MATDDAAPHPTEHTWVLWEHRPAEKKTMTKQEWGNLQNQIFEFSSVEEFWQHYDHVPKPSQVFYDGKSRKRVGAPPQDRYIESFSLFKKGIAPEWEDKENINGGEWNLRKQGRGPDEYAMLDEWWDNLVLGLVGETVDPGNYICGARVVDKSNGKGSALVYRIELWLATKDDDIKGQLKRRLIDVMTEGRNTPRGFADQFQWKLHS